MAPDADLLTQLLEQVSRSFYLTLRILPAPVRRQIGLAYLLARTTDTIADTAIIPPEQRLAVLQRLRERILGVHQQPLPLAELARQQGARAERALLERVEESLSLLNEFSKADQACIREVLRVISSGQELDLARFAGAGAQNIIPLRTDAELDDYTYRVAGCVGEFWTRLCRAHLFPEVSLDESALVADAVRFGKGLQLVNVLRDVPGDLRQGRCYLPAEPLARVGLSPVDLLSPAVEPRLRPLYDRYLAQARDHLEAGWAYTLALPPSAGGRVRLGCAWPILLGVATLKSLAVQNVLDPAQHIKVPRPEVRRILWKTVVRYPFRRWWGRLFAQFAAPLQRL
jgi:farnesyl-diphosphate farnesyltransferase